MDVDEPSASGGLDKDLFESTLDKAFQRFADQLSQNPEQVLRYEFKGAPLLYNRSDAVGKLLAPASEGQGGGKVTIKGGSASRMPKCKNCGAERVFEVQLTPHAITELEGDSMSINGMDWGTIILGVCGKDCTASDVGEGEVGYLEEWVGVQWEELAKK
jgi:pre-rRNA-processing protein TSR4